MAGTTPSSTYNNLSGAFQSSSTSSTAGAGEQAQLRTERLNLMTSASGDENLLDRLLGGSTASYNHESSIEAKINVFSAQFGASNAPSSSTNGNNHST
ncbi:hypothetical protein AAE478_010218 [Parahypoxylon ruwenzoriense]